MKRYLRYLNLKPCPLCECMHPLLCHVWAGGRGYFVECPICHNCGKTKITKRGAVKVWNKKAGVKND